jgi:hypothetical protein
MVDTLAIYVPNRYPTLAQIYRSLEPLVVSLMLGGDHHFSEDQLNVSLEKVLGNEADKLHDLEMLQIPDLKFLSTSVGSSLIHTQRTQGTVRNS